jgi:hypothetical protein
MTATVPSNGDASEEEARLNAELQRREIEMKRLSFSERQKL